MVSGSGSGAHRSVTEAPYLLEIGIRKSSEITRHYVLLDIEEALRANVRKITRSPLLADCSGIYYIIASTKLKWRLIIYYINLNSKVAFLVSNLINVSKI